MPVRNAGSFLVEALLSMQNQSYDNFELICIDDASTDGSYKTLKEFARKDNRIRIYRNVVKKGIGASLNIAIRLAKGAYLARMDADDISLPNRLKKQVELLEKHPTLVACGGQAAMIDYKGRIFGYKRFPTDCNKLYPMIMRMIPLQHPILMARARVFKQYRYNEQAATAEDVDMLFYLFSKGHVSNVDQVIYKYRKSSRSNGFHDVKKTFYITFMNRFRAIEKYGYNPTISGIMITLLQFLVVTLLPQKAVVSAFEFFRYERDWKKMLISRIRIPTLKFPIITNFNPKEVIVRA